MIDVGDDADVVRRIHINREDEHQNYAALSYCWGQKQSLTLATLNINEWRLHGLPFPSLPRTIRDAIVITRKIGLRFIWIDALCIIQDSDIDKTKEIGRMGDIYQNAYVTIVAASAKHCDEGILDQPLPNNNKQFTVPFLCLDGKLGSLTLQEWQAYKPPNQPIDFRAWTLQERLLSPRILIYTENQLFWECQTMLMSNGGIHTRPEPRGPISLPVSVTHLERLFNRIFQKRPWEEGDTYCSKFEERFTDGVHDRYRFFDFWSEWRYIIEDYTSRNHSLEQDRLLGLSGLATHFHAALPADETYVAGLWINVKDGARQFLHDLRWRCPVSTPKPNTYIAPSWSWASQLGSVIFGPRAETPTVFCTVLRWVIRLESIDLPFGRVKEGSYLEIRGPLEKAKADIGSITPRGIRFSADKRLDPNEAHRSFTLPGHLDIDGDELLQVKQVMDLWLLRLTTTDGLLLLSVEENLCFFRRVGLFSSSKKEINKLFKECEPQTIKIV